MKRTRQRRLIPKRVLRPMSCYRCIECAERVCSRDRTPAFCINPKCTCQKLERIA